MVSIISISKKSYYKCGSCELVYKRKSTAKKCEDYCNKHKSCSLKIIKHAIAQK